MIPAGELKEAKSTDSKEVLDTINENYGICRESFSRHRDLIDAVMKRYHQSTKEE